MTITRLVHILILLVACFAIPANLVAQNRGSTTAPATTLPAGSANFDYREWLILVCDPYQTQANANASIASTLPDFIDTRRNKAPTAQQPVAPMPLGVIRLRGETTAKIDVKIDTRAGRFMTIWPGMRVKQDGMLWRDLSLSSQPRPMTPIGSDHWLGALRGGKASYLELAGRTEQFLLYDVELSFPPPLKIGGAAAPDDPAQVSSNTSAPLRDVTIFRRDAAQWRSGLLAELPARPAGIPPATTGPSTEIRLELSTATRPADLLAEWKQRLTAMDFDTQDVEMIARILQSQLNASRRMTVVYRMDDAELDKLLPVEVVPLPRTSRRVALVVVRNAEPVSREEIDALIAQLGDREWRKREEAMQALALLGAAARAKLTVAVKNEDPEIAIRAERLMAAMSKDAPPANPNVNPALIERQILINNNF